MQKNLYQKQNIPPFTSKLDAGQFQEVNFYFVKTQGGLYCKATAYTPYMLSLEFGLQLNSSETGWTFVPQSAKKLQRQYPEIYSLEQQLSKVANDGTGMSKNMYYYNDIPAEDI